MIPMVPTEEVELTNLIAVLKALGEPNRLRIFATLMTGDSCNCELQEQLDLPANLLSHHLRVLSQAGLVNSRRDVIDGRWLYYSVDSGAAARWRDWFHDFMDPDRIQERPLCGPEGQMVKLTDIAAIDKQAA